MPPIAFAAAAPTIALTICAGILDLLDLTDHSLIDACTDRTRRKACSCDLAHDAADDGVDDDLSAAAVVGEVVREAEGFFTEGGGKLLLLLDLLLVEDFAEFVQCVLRIAAEGREILRGILAHLDRSLCDGGSCRALRLALGRHGEVGGEADGVVEIVLFLRALLLVVTVVVVCRPDALRAVVGTVLQIAERERPRAETILLLIRLTCDDRALEVGVLLDVDVEAAFASEDADCSRTLL